MIFKAKLRIIGNSQGIYIPKEVITGYNIGDEIELEVITKRGKGETMSPKVITPVLADLVEKKPFNTKWCDKHSAYKGSCGCN